MQDITYTIQYTYIDDVGDETENVCLITARRPEQAIEQFLDDSDKAGETIVSYNIINERRNVP